MPQGSRDPDGPPSLESVGSDFKAGKPTLLADVPSQYDSAIPQSVRDQVAQMEERFTEYKGEANMDSDDPVPYRDTTLQSEYTPGVLDSVIQSNKVRSVLGSDDQTRDEVLKTVVKATDPNKKAQLLRPTHFTSNVQPLCSWCHPSE